MLSNLKSISLGEESVPLKVVVQGYNSLWQIAAKNPDDTPFDLSNTSLKCSAEFALCSFQLTSGRDVEPSATISAFEILEKEPRDLPITKDVDPTKGLASLTFPADLYTENIPPDITANVPVAILRVSATTGTETRVRRALVVFQRGLT